MGGLTVRRWLIHPAGADGRTLLNRDLARMARKSRRSCVVVLVEHVSEEATEAPVCLSDTPFIGARLPADLDTFRPRYLFERLLHPLQAVDVRCQGADFAFVFRELGLKVLTECLFALRAKGLQCRIALVELQLGISKGPLK